ncbi:endonuclease domain-containing protein [Arthrobacter methylotrophus]|uniref:Endonuclease domain-containing protein n=1 Tax=Arthrobacter methylotrophus TaxID=121291 RepID=A0ABV5UW75_9MICC
MDVEQALNRCGGVARRPVLARFGISDAQLRKAVLGGVRQPARGIYALASAPDADVELVRNRQSRTCVSAAPFHGLWAIDHSGPPHVHQLRSHGRNEVHHGGLVLPSHPHRPVVSLADVLIHALRCLPWQESLVMVECAVGRGDMTVPFLLERLPGKRNGKAREVLQWVDRGADSLLETLARTHFRRAGIHVQPQFYIDGVGYMDLLLDGWLLVELDGRHHAEWKQVKKDHRRNNLSVIQGYTVLRYYYSDVVHDSEAMVAEVLAVLGRGKSADRASTVSRLATF